MHNIYKAVDVFRTSRAVYFYLYNGSCGELRLRTSCSERRVPANEMAFIKSKRMHTVCETVARKCQYFIIIAL